ncbi:MAG: DUF192 domain-containing protein [Phycisphaerales bacterium]|nr:DUF192 domain-containing protein [Phycisphaerales bacterium]
MRMKKTTLIRVGLLAIVIAAMGGLAYAANWNSGDDAKATKPPVKAKSGLPVEQLIVQGTLFDLEVAANTVDIARGLSKRTEIAEKTGMIFVFPSGNERFFWMIDCLIDLDIAYLSADGTVLSVYTMKKEAPRGKDESDMAYENRLKRYPSGAGAQFAIETPVGTNAALKIKPGLKIDINRKKLLGYLPR